MVNVFIEMDKFLQRENQRKLSEQEKTKTAKNNTE
jgi:hypothetical protein